MNHLNVKTPKHALYAVMNRPETCTHRHACRIFMNEANSYVYLCYLLINLPEIETYKQPMNEWRHLYSAFKNGKRTT